MLSFMDIVKVKSPVSLRYLTLRRSGFKRTYSSDLRFQKSIQYLSVENSWPQEIITSPLCQFDLSSVFKIFPYSVWNALVKNSVLGYGSVQYLHLPLRIDA